MVTGRGHLQAERAGIEESLLSGKAENPHPPLRGILTAGGRSRPEQGKEGTVTGESGMRDLPREGIAMGDLGMRDLLKEGIAMGAQGMLELLNGEIVSEQDQVGEMKEGTV